MSGRLTRIEKVINSQLDSLHVKVVPRGVPYFVDSLLKGTIRFAVRTGANNAVLNPQNTFRIGSEIPAGVISMEMSEVSSWMDIDSILSVGPYKETVVLEDIIDNKIVFNQRLKFSYQASDEILLYATPLIPNGLANKGAKLITVLSKYKLGNGDVLTYPATPGFLQSLTESKILKATYGGISANPVYKYVYVLSLEKELSRDIVEEEKVYFRSFPAYFSPQIRVPNLYNSTVDMGPFLLDYMSGKITEGFNPDEYFSIKLLDRAKGHNLGTEFEYVDSSKNYVVLKRPIDSRTFALFNVIKGDARLKPNRVVMDVDSDRKFRISQSLTPELDFTGQKYRFSTISNTSGTLILYFEPGDKIEITIAAGNQSHLIGIPSGIKYRMDVVFVSDTDKGRLQMSNWTQVGPQIQFIEYSLVVHTDGRGKYQTTGLILKPYFITPEILRGRYDYGESFDGGFAFF